MLEQIKGKHLLVDGDIYAYRCAASAEKTKYLIQLKWPEGAVEYHERESFKETKEWNDRQGYSVTTWSRKEVQPLEFALQACKTALDTLFTKLSPSKVSVFLSPERTFRHSLATTRPYKGNRVQPKPKYLKEVKEYLIREHGATVGDNIEADDEIGMALSKDPTGAVSVSIDKDLLQIPGWHYNWVNDTVQQVSSRSADFSFYTQMLTGDPTDNVPGIAGMGPKGAAKILDGATSRSDLCSRVWGIYRNMCIHPEEAREYFIEQYNLLYILRVFLEHEDGPRLPIELK